MDHEQLHGWMIMIDSLLDGLGACKMPIKIEMRLLVFM